MRKKEERNKLLRYNQPMMIETTELSTKKRKKSKNLSNNISLVGSRKNSITEDKSNNLKEKLITNKNFERQNTA